MMIKQLPLPNFCSLLPEKHLENVLPIFFLSILEPTLISHYTKPDLLKCLFKSDLKEKTHTSQILKLDMVLLKGDLKN